LAALVLASVSLVSIYPVEYCRSHENNPLQNEYSDNNDNTILLGDAYSNVTLLPNNPLHHVTFMAPRDLPSECLDSDKSNYLALLDADCNGNYPCYIGRQAVQDQFDYQGPALLDSIPYEYWIGVNGSIYDMTVYIKALESREASDVAAYLATDLHEWLMEHLDSHTTTTLLPNPMYQICLDEQFFVGIYHNDDDDTWWPCQSPTLLLLWPLWLILALMSLPTLLGWMWSTCLYVRPPDVAAAEPGVLILCTGTDIAQTVESCRLSRYRAKILVLVVSQADAALVEPLLGFAFSPTDPVFGFGAHQAASVYTGVYGNRDESTQTLRFLVLVVRDTDTCIRRRQALIWMQGLFNRVHYNRSPDLLDIALVKALYSQGMPVRDLQYLVCVDAPTVLHTQALRQMVATCEDDTTILACGSDTLLSNSRLNVWTWMQAYAVHQQVFGKQALASALGSVSTLPGCAHMYRIASQDDKPLLSHDPVVQEFGRQDLYSVHEQHVYHDDNALTLLLLQSFPRGRVVFCPDAVGYVPAPEYLSTLCTYRQAVRNRDLHTAYQTLRVPRAYIMKMVAVLDLLWALIGPALVGFAVYIMVRYQWVWDELGWLVPIVTGSVLVVTILALVAQRGLRSLGYLLFYIVFGIPVFLVIVPLLSWFSMDHFGWEPTRRTKSRPYARNPSSSNLVSVDAGKSSSYYSYDEPAADIKTPMDGDTAVDDASSERHVPAVAKPVIADIQVCNTQRSAQQQQRQYKRSPSSQKSLEASVNSKQSCAAKSLPPLSTTSESQVSKLELNAFRAYL